MITDHERQALIHYLKFLLDKGFLQPIVDKHVSDSDVATVAYDTLHQIVTELDQTIYQYQRDSEVELSPKKG